MFRRDSNRGVGAAVLKEVRRRLVHDIGVGEDLRKDGLQKKDELMCGRENMHSGFRTLIMHDLENAPRKIVTGSYLKLSTMT